MNEIPTYVIGNLVHDPVLRHVASGVPVATMRVASTARRFDRTKNEWVNGHTTFVSVVCWRRTAEHAVAALRKGDPVVVFGRLTGRTYDYEGKQRYELEIEATAVAPDLARVAVELRRRDRPAAPGAPAGGGVVAEGGAASDPAIEPAA